MNDRSIFSEPQGFVRKQIRNTMYDMMEFPPYEFREFPQAIPVVGGKIQPTPYNAKGKLHPVVIVNSQAELDALQGPEVELVPINPTQVSAESVQRVETEDDVRAALYRQAEQLGVKIDKKWSVARIEDTIKAAAEAKEVV